MERVSLVANRWPIRSMMLVTDAAFAALGDEKFLSLTTFRKSGECVSTPVWVGRDGDALIVTTPEASGKVKRLRNSPRVEVRPCSRFGRVNDGIEPVDAAAELLTDVGGLDRQTGIIREKYGRFTTQWRPAGAALN